MRLITRLVIAFCSGFLSAACAHASSVDDRVATLLPWVGNQTGYSVAYVQPTVSFDKIDDINKRYYGQAYAGQKDIEAYTVGTHITVRDDYQSPRDDYIVVHELVHVLQFEHGDIDIDGKLVAYSTKFQCLNQTEHQAYEVQGRYVDLTGLGWKADLVRFAFSAQCPTYPGMH
ncbi:MAG TPA: DUF4157 domain-containing protein [Candidatus Paceibacterota bacterium]|nr:DUF4157 domain-containing protein [Candidatus Paceibacterota bacterium]